MEVKLVSYQELLDIANREFEKLKTEQAVKDEIANYGYSLYYLKRFKNLYKVFMNMHRIKSWVNRRTIMVYMGLNLAYRYDGNEKKMKEHLKLLKLSDNFFTYISEKEREYIIEYGLQKYNSTDKETFEKTLEAYRIERFVAETINALQNRALLKETNFYLEVGNTIYVTPEFFLGDFIYKDKSFYNGGELAPELLKLKDENKDLLEKIKEEIKQKESDPEKWFSWCVKTGMSGLKYKFSWGEKTDNKNSFFKFLWEGKIKDKNSFLKILSIINNAKNPVYNIFLKHLAVSYAAIEKLDNQITINELKEVGIQEKELLPLFNNNITIRNRTNNISIEISKELNNVVKINVSKNNINQVIENLESIYENIDILEVKTRNLTYADFYPYLKNPEKLLRSYVVMSKDSPTNKKVLSKIANKILEYFSSEKKLKEISSNKFFDYYIQTMGKLVLEGKIDLKILSNKLKNSKIRQRLIDVIMKRDKSMLPIYFAVLEKYLTVSEVNRILPNFSKEDISKILTYLSKTGNTELTKAVTIFLNSHKPGKKGRLVI